MTYVLAVVALGAIGLAIYALAAVGRAAARSEMAGASLSDMTKQRDTARLDAATATSDLNATRRQLDASNAKVKQLEAEIASAVPAAKQLLDAVQ